MRRPHRLAVPASTLRVHLTVCLLVYFACPFETLTQLSLLDLVVVPDVTTGDAGGVLVVGVRRELMSVPGKVDI